ncbi:MAG: S-methyl-5'-thioadenosine phosphorylase [Ponticaulis sp.]|nr:S-methyl-5'-thioadenosine phosphorylase [Ponticaulis sp.]|tara:strand:- start:136 stop:1008 length:873 start_codon:yes stop_codon:yes gene_type:complete
MSKWVLGVLGGSGLYEIDGLENAREEHIVSPWGVPSGNVMRGNIGDVELVFLPRHGKGHRLSPTHVNYRANIDILKRAGVTDILSISAVGSLQQQYPPGDFVVIDQFIDRSFAREKSFFGEGCVAHVSMAQPVCERLAGLAFEAGQAVGASCHKGGTYIVMEGPQFSTYAESQLYRSWGCDVIGMTNMPEAKLAREAELPYATVAMVTDYDCWHEEEEAVSVESVLKIMHGNSARAKLLIQHLAKELNGTPRTNGNQGIETCLDFALITPSEARDPELLAKLDAVAGRVL